MEAKGETEMQSSDMTLSQLYFSVEGRITRSTFWLKDYLPFLAIAILSTIPDVSVGTYSEELSMGLFGSLASLLMLYPSIAVMIKRLHDRDRSGWFILLLFIPLVNIWPVIEIYFLRGTDGENRYGADPSWV